MGWEGIHLYEFCLRFRRYGSWEVSASSPDVTLAALKLRRGARFTYGYDLNIPGASGSAGLTAKRIVLPSDKMASVLQPHDALIAAAFGACATRRGSTQACREHGRAGKSGCFCERWVGRENLLQRFRCAAVGQLWSFGTIVPRADLE